MEPMKLWQRNKDLIYVSSFVFKKTSPQCLHPFLYGQAVGKWTLEAMVFHLFLHIGDGYSIKQAGLSVTGAPSPATWHREL